MYRSGGALWLPALRELSFHWSLEAKLQLPVRLRHSLPPSKRQSSSHLHRSGKSGASQTQCRFEWYHLFPNEPHSFLCAASCMVGMLAKPSSMEGLSTPPICTPSAGSNPPLEIGVRDEHPVGQTPAAQLSVSPMIFPIG